MLLYLPIPANAAMLDAAVGAATGAAECISSSVTADDIDSGTDATV